MAYVEGDGLYVFVMREELRGGAQHEQRRCHALWWHAVHLEHPPLQHVSNLEPTAVAACLRRVVGRLSLRREPLCLLGAQRSL